MMTADEIRSLMTGLGMNQPQFAEYVGVSQPTVSRWLKGQVPDHAQDKVLRQISLDLNEQWERENPRFQKPNLKMAEIRKHQDAQRQERISAQSQKQEQNIADAPDAPDIDKGLYPREVHLIGLAACGSEGDFRFNGETGDYVRRPPGLERRFGVYALHLIGESMYPAFRHGDLVYVDPNREPGPGEDAVIEMYPESDGEPGPGYLKRVVRVRGGKIECEQFNPPEPVTFDRADVKRFHRVIPWSEVLGY